VTNWHEWHDRYDDRESSLSRRLRVVRQRLDEVLRERPVRRVLSLCAGDGRDIIPVVAGHPVETRPEALLVELDPALAAAAEQRAVDAGVTATVIAGDAGEAATWRDVVPVDLLMLCGVFGNVTDDDVRTTVAAARAMVNPRGTVVWTRGHVDGPDARPWIRAEFTAAGFSELSFDAEPVGYGVGVNRLDVDRTAALIPDRLFSFVR
jgi:hypothetical protein